MIVGFEQAVEAAERILPGEASSEDRDPRWQAVIAVADYIDTDPEPVWAFASRWGASPDEDLRIAIATCVLEHLLEHHFETIFPRVESACDDDPRFADCFARCWSFGQTNDPEHRRRFDALRMRVRQRKA